VEHKAHAIELWQRLITHMKTEEYSKSTVNLTIAALIDYSKTLDFELPNIIKHQRKVTMGMGKRSKERSMLKDSLVAAISKDFPLIFTADLSGLNKKPFVQEEARFMVIHAFYCGMRISEVVKSLVSDYKKDGSLPEHNVRASKTKDIYWRPISEDKYWQCRREYVELLKKQKCYTNIVGLDFLFPKVNGGNTPMSTLSAYKLIAGASYGYGTTKGVRYKPGVCQLVWGKRAWTHIFRHMRTNNLLEIMPLEEVKEWRHDSSIDTTMAYVSETHTRKSMMESLKNRR
jgi:integrase